MRLPVYFETVRGVGVMEKVSVSELRFTWTAVLEKLREGGGPLVITARGTPVAVLQNVDALRFSLEGDEQRRAAG